MSFYEAIWHGEGIGDGGDLEESLQAYVLVKPEDGDWTEACAKEGANPHVDHYSSFDAYLDNADAIETIPVTPAMIAGAVQQLSS